MQDGWERATKAPAKKNTKKWCKGKTGVEHKPEIRKSRYHASMGDKAFCRWVPRWTGWRSGGWDYKNPRWLCFHEEFCTTCGKITRHTIDREECPEYKEFVPGEPVAARYY